MVRFFCSHGAALLPCMVATTGALPSASHAQDGPPVRTATTPPQTEAGTGQRDETVGLGDIVVTARKRAENLRDVPIAITAISGEQLQAKNVTQIVDLAAITPNFQFTYGAIQPITTIRGFGSGANISFDQSVGKFVDNVSYGRDQDGRIPFFDVERLEVLKGPQVIAFGNSATVGALNVITRQPGDRLSADGSVAYEIVAREFQGQGGVDVPVSANAFLRVAGLVQDLSSGRLRNVLRGRDETTTRNFAVRPTLRVDATERLRIVLHGEFDHLHESGDLLQTIGQPLSRTARPYVDANDIDTRYADYRRAPVSADEEANLHGGVAQADVRYNIAGGTLTSTTAFRATKSHKQSGAEGPDNAETQFNFITQRYHQFSQELRFNGTYGALDASAGAYFQHDFLRATALQDFLLGGFGATGAAATPFARVVTYDQRTNTYSGYMDLTYRLTHALSVSGGLRHSRIVKDVGQEQFATPIVPGVGYDTTRADLVAARSTALNPLLTAVLGVTPHAFPLGALHLAESEWQPQAIVQYRITERDNVYLKYVQGEKAGGFDFLYAGIDPAAARFRPEKAESVELGFKGLTLGGRLEYAVDIYRTTFTSLQQSVFTSFGFLVSNVGKARSQGLEADLVATPARGLRLRANASYLDAKYVDYRGAACGSNLLFITPRGCSQDLSGVSTPYASKWTGLLSADYHSSLGSHKVGAGVSVLARSRYNAGPFNDPRMEESASAVVDAHLDLSPTGGPWTLSLFGRNLSDRRTLEYAVTPIGQGTAVAGIYSRGRQVGVRLSLDTR